VRRSNRPRVVKKRQIRGPRRAPDQREDVARYRDLLDKAGDAILVADAETGVFLEANAKAEQLLGIPRQELLGRQFLEIHPPERAEQYRQLFQWCLDHPGSVLDSELWVLHRDGRRIPVEISCGLMEWDGRRVAQAIFRDITPRRRLEKIIRTQRDLATALNETPDLESGLRLCLEASLSLTAMHGGGIYLVDDATGALNLAVHHGLSPEFLASVSHFEADAASARLVAAGRPVYSSYSNLDTPMAGRAQTEGLRGIAMVPICHRGRVLGCINVASHSATEVPATAREALETTAAQVGGWINRLKTEQALRESEERFRAAAEGTQDGLWDWPDITQDHVWWSGRFRELLGYSEGELEAGYSSSFKDLVHPEDLPVLETAVRSLRDDHNVLPEIELRLRTRSGEYRWFCGRGVLARTSEGRPPRLSGSIRDITDQRRAKAERAGHLAKLRNLTAQLALAEEQERRRIAVGVHDDIGQRLVLAKLELQYLRQRMRTSKLAQGVDRVCSLIDQTMEEAHSLSFELSNPVLYEVGFAEAVESLLSQRVVKAAGLTWSFASDFNGAKLDEDVAVTLFQAVREVLTNCIKHAQARRVEVRIGRLKNQIRVTVEDDGVGMDPGLLDRSTDAQRGLGLFHVKERLEGLKGRVEVHSSTGKGTTVILVAPFKASDRGHARPKAE